MAARTALITGILGQDGSLLAELLQSRGYRVVGVARAGSTAAVDGLGEGIVLATTDLSDPMAVRALLAEWRPDEVYHLAAFHHSSQDNSVSSVLKGKDAMLATNFLATKTIAFGMAETNPNGHLVFASSSQAYTAKEMCHEVDEQTPRQPATFYGHVKSWSMDLLSLLRADSGLRASIAILFNHESTRRGTQFVSRKITRAAALARSGAPSALHLQNIGARVDWSSAGDVVRALSLMGASESLEDYVVASGTLHSVRDLLHEAFGHVGLDWRQFTTYQEEVTRPTLVGRPGFLESSLGWQRTVSFEEMVAEMVDHDLALLDHSS